MHYRLCDFRWRYFYSRFIISSSPDFTFQIFLRIHFWSRRTIKIFGESFHVWKCSLKLKLELVFPSHISTWTLNWSGEWVPVTTESLRASGLDLEHHTLAALIQNICRGEKLRPGSRGSSPLILAHSSKQGGGSGGGYDLRTTHCRLCRPPWYLRYQRYSPPSNSGECWVYWQIYNCDLLLPGCWCRWDAGFLVEGSCSCCTGRWYTWLFPDIWW